MTTPAHPSRRRTHLAAPCAALLLATAAAHAFAQPAATPPAPLPDAQPAPAPPDGEQIAAALIAAAVAHYRAAPWDEELTLTVVSASGGQRSSTVRVACIPGPAPTSVAHSPDAADPTRPPDSPRPVQALRLELGTLVLVATPTRLAAINTLAPTLAYEAALDPARPMLAQVVEILPALPFPQVHLALAADDASAFDRAVASIAPAASGARARLGVDSGRIALHAPATDVPLGFEASIVPETGRLVEVVARDAAARAAPGARVAPSITISVRDRGVPPLADFNLSIAGRTRVESLSRLRPPEPEILVGNRMPPLGLVDERLALWTPAAALARARIAPAQVGPRAVVLILYPAAGGAALDDALEATLRARDIADRLSREASLIAGASDPTLIPPRAAVVPVAVLELEAFGPQRVADEALLWSELGTPAAFTSAGAAALRRFDPTLGVTLVMIDAEQTIKGMVRWAETPESLRSRAIEDALRGKAAEPVPEPVPEPQPGTEPGTQPAPGAP
jgi:hypothetical protein